MTRRTLLRNLDAAELAEWEEYWALEPFENTWQMTAKICLSVVTAGGVKKRNGSKWTEEDFMPAGYRPPKTRDDSADAIEANLMVWATATNAEAKKAKKR